ncbi:uncharacterized protein BX663DRAFT_563582 [Cokeromyces recurvatus]|uniref:uncharacterized protein n=1 Tax=Cokeromyces recurvatus TaxID=90255 RepID=UPI00221F2485|nr:uncharacterized protein BX663DRAFT_563582 [Cokeromyces recurvatus]KAI7899874.1 hypothetical protein BX663DRAFT_563582 [Cokeromyces recurvatus]
MSWLNSPKRIFKFLLLFLSLSLSLVFLLPSPYPTFSTTTTTTTITKITHSNDTTLSNVAFNQVKLPTLNTTWDDEYNPWVISNPVYNPTNQKINFLKGLMSYTTKGHDYDTLIYNQVQLQDVTIILPIYSKNTLSKLDVLISSWTSVPVNFEVSIICSSQLKPLINEKIVSDNIKIKVTAIDRSIMNTDVTESDGFSAGTAGASVWLQALHQHEINTEYIYVLDENMPLSESSLNELEYLMKVHQNDDYKDALIGTRALVFNPQSTTPNHFCLPVDTHLPIDLSQPADMILGAWLLRKSWLPYIMIDISLESLKLPLGYYISLNLNHQLNIPTVFLPSPQIIINKQLCEQALESWNTNVAWKTHMTKNQFPTVLQHRFFNQPNVLLIIKSTKQFISLYPLICRFKDPVHLALLGDDINKERVQHVLNETNCQSNIEIHDFTLERSKDILVGQLVKMIHPHIMIQVKPINDPSAMPLYYSLKLVAETYQITEIGLPENEIVHALWIPNLSLDALSNWNKIQIKLVMITDRRPHSLSRLLQSASKSIYLGDQVDLMINMEQSSDRVTRMLVNSFVWKYGKKTLRHRIRKGGLMPAIVESWYPSHNHEYAVLLEDDIEVSPLFYVWSKYAILKYRYSGNQEAYRLMYGISLYAPRNLELIPAGRVSFNPNSVLLPAGFPNHIPYASQIPCSWGAVYFPEHWREFHAYLVRRLEDLNLPKGHRTRLISVPGSRSDKWKKSWKKYFIELVYLRAYVMLYPNFQGFEAFSTNHVEFGTHVKSEKRQSVIGTFMELPVMDLWGKLQTLETLEDTAQAYHRHVSTCERTYGTFDPQEFFCLVDGPPDPPQKFPMSPKKPKPPVLVKDVVQPIQYNYIYDHDVSEEERNKMFEWMPKPIDVAQLPTVEDRFSYKDDEMLDLENDLDTLNRLYLKLYPENLEFLEDEKMNFEEEEEEEEKDDDDDDDDEMILEEDI